MHRFLWLPVVIVAVTGCSGDGQLPISGRVTLGGRPLENGTIDFLSAGGDGPTAGAVVENGQYTVRIAPGPKMVRIRGYEKVGQEHAIPNDPSSPMVDVNRQVVPAKYNAQSELECEVVAGTDTYDFALDRN